MKISPTSVLNARVPSARTAMPSTASVKPADHTRRRNSPSLIEGMPMSS
jgi:hypothetical protein